jgi:hypothetical protein
MNKNSWYCTSKKSVEARIYARSNVEWVSSAGTTLCGKVKQIFGDYVNVSGDDGSNYIVQMSLLRKKRVEL